MIEPLRVGLLAEDARRTHELAALVEEAGHVVVAADLAEVLVADGAAPQSEERMPTLPVVAIGLRGAEMPFAALLTRTPSARQLDAAIRAAAAGLIVQTGVPSTETGFQAAEDGGPLLTPREVEVLAAISMGLSNKEVARHLGISAHTVKFHLESSFRKLGATTRAEAVAKGLRRGLIEV